MNITSILVINIQNSVGLNICLYFQSYSPSLNKVGNKTEKNLSVLISFGLEKSVGLNILVKSVLIFSVLVTGPHLCQFYTKIRYKIAIGPILYTIIFPEQVVQNINDFNTKKL
jgi:hypothetical protein